jgi:hypothetical protein
MALRQRHRSCDREVTVRGTHLERRVLTSKRVVRDLLRALQKVWYVRLQFGAARATNRGSKPAGHRSSRGKQIVWPTGFSPVAYGPCRDSGPSRRVKSDSLMVIGALRIPREQSFPVLRLKINMARFRVSSGMPVAGPESHRAQVRALPGAQLFAMETVERGRRFQSCRGREWRSSGAESGTAGRGCRSARTGRVVVAVRWWVRLIARGASS